MFIMPWPQSLSKNSFVHTDCTCLDFWESVIFFIKMKLSARLAASPGSVIVAGWGRPFVKQIIDYHVHNKCLHCSPLEKKQRIYVSYVSMYVQLET